MEEDSVCVNADCCMSECNSRSGGYRLKTCSKIASLGDDVDFFASGCVDDDAVSDDERINGIRTSRVRVEGDSVIVLYGGGRVVTGIVELGGDSIIEL